LRHELKRATKLWESGNKDAAIACFEAGVRDHQANAESVIPWATSEWFAFIKKADTDVDDASRLLQVTTKSLSEEAQLTERLASAHLALGAKLFNAGRRKEAEAEFREALRLDPANATTHNNLGYIGRYFLALLHMARNDRAGYSTTCAEMMSTFGDTKDVEAARWTAWSCVLGPEALDDYAPVIELARRFENNSGLPRQPLAGLLFRAGRYADALSELNSDIQTAAGTRAVQRPTISTCSR
jgi:tetratricopeptide (TPR) repeat protein